MSELIIVGDRVLIEPQDGEKQTKAGLYLPATVTEKERVGSGVVVQIGPGYVMPNPEYAEGEPWTQSRNAVRYLPLQARPGDLAFYLRKDATEITYEKKTFVIVTHDPAVAQMTDRLIQIRDGRIMAEKRLR